MVTIGCESVLAPEWVELGAGHGAPAMHRASVPGVLVVGEDLALETLRDRMLAIIQARVTDASGFRNEVLCKQLPEQVAIGIVANPS